MASEESSNESPSLADVWKVLTEIKTNTEKPVLGVNSLKVNYKELQDNFASVKAQVDILVGENKIRTSKVKSLEDIPFFIRTPPPPPPSMEGIF